MRQLQRVWDHLLEFFFHPVSDSWLTVLRMGVGLQVALYCLSLRHDWNHFLAGSEGLINRDLMEAILEFQAPFVPRIGWLVSIGHRLGVSEQTVLPILWITLLAAGCSLVIGFFCRGSAIVAWFLYLCAVKSGNLLTYGVDNFTTIGLFYVMLAPFPDGYALDAKMWKTSAKDRHLHGFFRRLLQLHLCLIYFFGGLSKCLGAGWWNGESMWRALTRAPFNVVPLHLIVSFKAALPFVGIAVCVLETAYPFFIWPKRTRLGWLIAVIGMHIAIGLTMGLYLFALIMIILNIAAFGTEFISIPVARSSKSVAQHPVASSRF